MRTRHRLPSRGNKNIQAAWAMLTLSTIAGTASAQTPLACDTEVNGMISTPTEVDSFSFAVAADEIVGITVAKTTPSGLAFSPAWRLVDFNGSAASSCGFLSTARHLDCGPLDAAGSPYRIEISDNGENDTGSYSVYYQRLTDAQSCDQTALTCDVPTTGQIDNPLDTDLFSIAVADNEIISVTVLKGSPTGVDFQPAWRLLKSDGALADDCGNVSSAPQRDCGPLPASGSPYRVELSDQGGNDTGAYRVRFSRSTASAACEQTPIVCDLPLAGQISPVSDSDLFSFSVVEGETVAVQVVKSAPAGLNFAPSWRLIAGDGDRADACSGFTTATLQNCGPLPVAGNPYRIEVTDTNNDDTGAYNVRLQRITAGQACEVSPLTCDVPSAGQINNPLDSDLFSLTVSTTEQISVQVIPGTPSGLNFRPAWRLLDAAGAGAGGCGLLSTAATRACGPLEPGGSPYSIEVFDQSTDDTGAYQLRFQRLTQSAACESAPLVCDVPASGAIDSPLDTDLWSFTAVDGERIALTAVANVGEPAQFSPSWRLLNADGSTASACGSFSTGASRDCGPLLAANSPYQVEVIDQNADAAGNYTLHLQRITAAAACEGDEITCDVVLDSTIDSPLDSDLLRLTVDEGESIRVSVKTGDSAGANFTPQWRMLAGNGQLAPDCSSFTALATDCGPLPAAGNPYQIEIIDRDRNDTGDFLAHVQRLTATSACDETAIACDDVVDGAIDHPLDSDLFTFDVSENEFFTVTVRKSETASETFTPAWRLIDAAGNAASDCGFFSGTLRSDCGPFAAAGSPYRIEVIDQGQDATGDYRVHLQRITSTTACDAETLPCDTTVADTIDSAIESDLWSFPVQEGEVVRIVIGADGTPPENFLPNWRLLANSGDLAPACSFPTGGSVECGPLPAAGSPYTIEVLDQNSDAAGAYVLNLQRLTSAAACDQTPLSCNSDTAGAFESPLDSDLYSFSVSEGTTIRVSMSSGDLGNTDLTPAWRLLAGSGAPAPACGNFSTSNSLACGPLPAAGNPYRIELAEQGWNATGPYNIKWEVQGGPCPASQTMLTQAKSRRTHGGSGTFDLDLPLSGTPAIEPRSDVGDPKVVLLFSEPPVATDGSIGCGDEIVVTNGSCDGIATNGNALIVDVTPNANTCVSVAVNGLVDFAGDDNVSFIRNVGNVNNDGTINVLDLQQIKNRLLQPVSAATFLYDVNVSGGSINILDLQASKNNFFNANASPCP